MSRAAVYEALLAAERFIERDRDEVLDSYTIGGPSARKQGVEIDREGRHLVRRHAVVLRKIRKAMDAL